MMGDTSKVNNTTTDSKQQPATTATQGVFHDFLGRKVANLQTVSGFPPEISPSGKQVTGQAERLSCYDTGNDQSVSEISHQFVGNKRNYTDSALVEASEKEYRHGIPESSHVMKLLRNASGGDRPRIPLYDGSIYGAHQIRPVSASFMLQQSAGNYGKLTKSERSIPMNVGGSSIQYNPYIGQASPVTYQMPSSRFREGGSGPSILSQLAADEGSRTGNKGSGIFQSVNTNTNQVSERNLSEPESPAPLSHSGLTSSSRQMTIIFGGQVHVFDDVHPSKADVIMGLAGANGGSWSTALPKSSARETIHESCLPSRDKDLSTMVDRPLPVKYESRNSNHGYGLNRTDAAIIRSAETAGKARDSRLKTKQEV